MAMHAFCLYGRDTAQSIWIGSGPSVMIHWGLQDFPGPTLQAQWIGYAEKKSVFLPQDLLLLLYERFRSKNPGGVSIAYMSELEERFAPSLSSQECEMLYEQRKMFVDLILTDEGRGYPHLRSYLPEVFERQRLQEIALDPWLDANLLAVVAPTLSPDGESINGLTTDLDRLVSPEGRSERWWPQWRAYCDALGTTRGTDDGAPAAT